MDHKGEFCRIIGELARRYDRHEVFNDFCEIAAITLRQVFERNPANEERYLKLIRRYEPEEQEKFARLLALTDDFTRYRISAIEADIDSHFKLARWKLFDVQVNGGVVDCCEATYNGVPYSDVNSAMRANLGVDIISAISAHYGLSVPLFCDNAESVSEYQPIDTQVIKLYVAPECGDIKVEVK